MDDALNAALANFSKSGHLRHSHRSGQTVFHHAELALKLQAAALQHGVQDSNKFFRVVLFHGFNATRTAITDFWGVNELGEFLEGYDKEFWGICGHSDSIFLGVECAVIS